MACNMSNEIITLWVEDLRLAQMCFKNFCKCGLKYLMILSSGRHSEF